MSRGSFSRRHRNRQEARMTTDTDEALIVKMLAAKPGWPIPSDIDLMRRLAEIVRQHDAPRIAALEAEGYRRGLREAWRIARARADAFADDTAALGSGAPSDMAVSIDTALRLACEPAVPFDGWAPHGLAEKEGRGNG